MAALSNWTFHLMQSELQETANLHFAFLWHQQGFTQLVYFLNLLWNTDNDFCLMWVKGITLKIKGTTTYEMQDVLFKLKRHLFGFLFLNSRHIHMIHLFTIQGSYGYLKFLLLKVASGNMFSASKIHCSAVIFIVFLSLLFLFSRTYSEDSRNVTKFD